jgi:chromosome segregation ATPase
MSLKIDPEILVRNLPEDIHATINQVSANVTVAVNQVVAQFKTSLDKELQNLQAGNYPAELKQQIASVEQSYAETTAALDKEIAALKKVADDAAAAAKTAGASAAALVPQIQAMQQSADALAKKMNDLRSQVQNLGGKTASAMATLAYKSLSGGIL